MTEVPVAALSVLPVAVALSLLAPLPAGAGPRPDPPGNGAGVPCSGPLALRLAAAGQEQAQPPAPQEETRKKKKKKKKADQPAASAETNDGVRMVWKTGPSLRLGKAGRVDFKLLFQGDLRSSDQDLEEAGGLFDTPRHQAGVKGNLFRVVEFEVMKEIDGVWRDVYVNVRPIAAAQVEAGKFKVPFSMDQTTARHSLDFI